MREILRHSRFKTDLKRVSRSERYKLDDVLDTIGNLEALNQIAAQNEFQSVILVSDALHLMRIKGYVRDMAFNLRMQTFASDYSGVFGMLMRAQWEMAAMILRYGPAPLWRVALQQPRS